MTKQSKRQISVTMDESYSYIHHSVMSNLDHSIDRGIAEKLKTGKYYSQYSGWDFCGYVFWDKTKWACEVWVYHNHEETIHGDTLEEIMDLVSDKYGSD